MKETPVQQRISLDAAQLGNVLWRNNVGSLPDRTGRWIRFGLANDSEKLNKKVKSSDHIGITPTIITQEMVGYMIGRFTAIESKKSDWVFNPNDEHTLAQLAYHDIVRHHGGLAGFATGVPDYRMIIGK